MKKAETLAAGNKKKDGGEQVEASPEESAAQAPADEKKIKGDDERAEHTGRME